MRDPKLAHILVCFVATLSDFGLLKKSTYRAEKDAFKEKIIRRTAWELLNP